MYRVNTEAGPTTHVYSGTEYDAFAVGEYRLVRSFCPRRHRYVYDYAAPIVPMRVKPSNPDAAMTPDDLEPRQTPTVQLIVDAMGDNVMAVSDIAAAIDKANATVNGTIRRYPDLFVVVGTERRHTSQANLYAVDKTKLHLLDDIDSNSYKTTIAAKRAATMNAIRRHIRENGGPVPLSELARLTGRRHEYISDATLSTPGFTRRRANNMLWIGLEE